MLVGNMAHGVDDCGAESHYIQAPPSCAPTVAVMQKQQTSYSTISMWDNKQQFGKENNTSQC